MKMKKIVKMPLRRSPKRPSKPASSLRARAATVEDTYDDEEDYDTEEEPNMKFSHALFVVLVLHIIAVGGVFAFNWMKTKQTTEAPAERSVVAEAPAETKAPEPAVAAKAPALDGWTGRTHTVEPGDTLIQIASTHKTSVAAIEKENDISSTSLLRVGQVLKIPSAEKATQTASTPKSGTTKEAFLATKLEKPLPGTITAVSRNGSQAAEVESAELNTTTTSDGEVYTVVKGDNPYTIAKKLHISYTELLKINDIDDPTKVQIGQKLKIPAK